MIKTKGEKRIAMKQLNIYEAPEVLILELDEEDIITTSVGDGGATNVGGSDDDQYGENWDW